eukprot:UC4_evm3s13
MLFSQPSSKQPWAATLFRPPTNNESAFRTHNVDVSSGPNDWTAKNPWRAPGFAQVLGSGCGVAGGGDMFNQNGGWPATGMRQGQDALTLPGPAQEDIPTKWQRGTHQEVAWGLWANHGGGYSYRLCKNDGTSLVTEECFQKNSLSFYGKNSTLQHINGSRFEIPRVMLNVGTYPPNSQWARNPIPGCKDHHGFADKCENGTEFDPPLPGLYGFGYTNSTSKGDRYHDYSIVDEIIVPDDILTGRYLISWRWTTQIWQNCADILIT